MDAASTGIATDSLTHARRQVTVPCSGEADAGDVSGGGKTSVAADAVGTVGHLKGGQVETRHGADSEAGAADVVEFFFEGHLLNDGIDPGADGIAIR